MDFQEIIMALDRYWSKQGCVLTQPYCQEVGAGTFSPYTFFGALGAKEWKAAFVQPSKRPADGRYGDNPNRLFEHHQYQVVIKPPPADIQDLYLKSLEAIGIKLAEHDIRFVEDDWESPTLGASGLGWEVWCDGMEITQYTYFQQIGSCELDPISVELTYGLERIAMFVQNKENVFDVAWVTREGSNTGNRNIVTYGYLRNDRTKTDKSCAMPYELEYSKYCFEAADTKLHSLLFDLFEKDSKRLLEEGLLYPAYDAVIKCSHSFNILDARGAVSVAERANYIGRVRALAKGCAQFYLDRIGGG